MIKRQIPSIDKLRLDKHRTQINWSGGGGKKEMEKKRNVTAVKLL